MAGAAPDFLTGQAWTDDAAGQRLGTEELVFYVLSRDDKWHVHPGTEGMQFVTDNDWLLLLTGWFRLFHRWELL